MWAGNKPLGKAAIFFVGGFSPLERLPSWNNGKIVCTDSFNGK